MSSKFFLVLLLTAFAGQLQAQAPTLNDPRIAYWKSVWPSLVEMKVGKFRIFIDRKLIVRQGYDEASGSFGRLKVSESSVEFDLDDGGVNRVKNEIFVSVDQDKKLREWIEVGSLICIPNNGNVYSVMNVTDTRIWITKKFHYSDGKLQEVQQPFYLQNIQTTTLSDIELQNRDSEEVIITIQKGTTVDVIGFSMIDHGPQANDPDLVLGEYEYWFLIKSASGIVGWHRLKILEPSHDNSGPKCSLPLIDIEMG